MTVLRRYCCLPRTALMVLLMLGVVISPVLAVIGELHGMEHAVIASDGTHHHVHSSDSDHPDHHGGDSDPDHAAGSHGLMHQTVNVSVTLPDTVLDVSTASAGGPRLPEFVRVEPPWDSPNLPFRPPIA